MLLSDEQEPIDPAWMDHESFEFYSTPKPPDASPSARVKSYSRARIARMSDEQLQELFVSQPGSRAANDAGNELIEQRYVPYLAKLAYRFARANRHIASQDDYLQHAKVGGLLALYRYNPKVAGERQATMRTFVVGTVEYYLKEMTNRNGWVRCPTQQSKAKRYVQNRMDDEEKALFEQSRELTTPEAVKRFRQMHSLLNPIVVSFNAFSRGSDHGEESTEFVDMMVDESLPTEEQIVDNLQCQQFTEELTERHQEVVTLYFRNDLQMHEAAEKLGLSTDQVRGDARTIRAQLARKNAALQDEMKQFGV